MTYIMGLYMNVGIRLMQFILKHCDSFSISLIPETPFKLELVSHNSLIYTTINIRPLPNSIIGILLE